MSALERLQAWYLSQCNEDWEHLFGIKIDTLDNPGWALDIDLSQTSLEHRSFVEFSYGVGPAAKNSGDNWVICKVEDSKFVARGGPGKLEEMITKFLDWAEAQR